MKAIFASKFYYRRAGLESYMLNLKRLLEKNGHKIIPFSTNYSQNDPSEYSSYFCKYHDISDINSTKVSTSILSFLNMFYNHEAYRKVKKLIDDANPSFFQGFGITKHLSFSVFKAAKNCNLKTIMRLSDYALICPASIGLDGNGRVCSDFKCTKHSNIHCIKTRCIKNSALMSFAGFFETKINQVLKTYLRTIDHFIAPSMFLRDIFLQYFKIPEHRITYCPIFFDPDGIKQRKIVRKTSPRPYVLYAGRLSPEKGILTLIEAAKQLNGVDVKIAGDGPQRLEVQKAAENHPSIELLGFLPYASLERHIAESSGLVIPSECFENSPNVVLEAYSHSVPAIGSNIGGIPELIVDGQTGYLFEMGNPSDLAQKISAIVDHHSELGQNGNAFSRERFNKETHYSRLMEIYNRVLRT